MYTDLIKQEKSHNITGIDAKRIHPFPAKKMDKGRSQHHGRHGPTPLVPIPMPVGSSIIIPHKAIHSTFALHNMCYFLPE